MCGKQTNHRPAPSQLSLLKLPGKKFEKGELATACHCERNSFRTLDFRAAQSRRSGNDVGRAIATLKIKRADLSEEENIPYRNTCTKIKAAQCHTNELTKHPLSSIHAPSCRYSSSPQRAHHRSRRNGWWAQNAHEGRQHGRRCVRSIYPTACCRPLEQQ